MQGSLGRELRITLTQFLEREGGLVGKGEPAFEAALQIFQITWAWVGAGARREFQEALGYTIGQLACELDEIDPKDRIEAIRQSVWTFRLCYALCLITKDPALRQVAEREKAWATARLHLRIGRRHEDLIHLLGAEPRFRMGNQLLN